MPLTIKQKAEYSGRGRWNWSIWLDGTNDELKPVTRVRYQLGRGHRPSTVDVTNRRTRFRLDSSGSAELMVRGEITFSDGRKPLKLKHNLKLDRPGEKGTADRSSKSRAGKARATGGQAVLEVPAAQFRWLAHKAGSSQEMSQESTQTPQTHVTLIHGIANKPTAESLLQHWLDALADSGGIDLRQPGIVVSMVYWADVLYAEPATELPMSAQESLFPAEDLPDGISSGWERTIPPDERAFVDSLRNRLRIADERALVAAGGDAGGGAEERVPLPWSIKGPVMEQILRDVHHYLFNVEFSPRPGETYKVQDEIRHRFAKGLKSVPAPRQIVVSHSMGTVIAYDCLKRVPGCPPIDTLITIGSPLGLDEVQDKLQPGWSRNDGFPATHARHWANVFDHFDPVCGFDPWLANDFKKAGRPVVEDINEQNSGWWRHDIQKYLRGALLRNALTRAVQGIEVPEESLLTEDPHPPTLFVTGSAASNGAKGPAQAPHSLVVFLRDLRSALDTFDHERTARLCDEFVRELRTSRSVPSAAEAAELLSQLRRKRAFRQMRQVADALIEEGQRSPKVRRQYVQAMIDEGLIAAGLTMARALVSDLMAQRTTDPTVADELAEAKGLIGRAYKQWYIEGGNPRHLQESLTNYYSVYRETGKLWHGINAVALRALANSDPSIAPDPLDHCRIARDILTEVERLDSAGTVGYWDRATAMEACVALHRTDDALRWARDYVATEDVDAFELASTLRQLKQIWKLDTSREPGSLLIPLLEAELLKREGGQVTLDQASVTAVRAAQQAGDARLQKVYGDDSYRNFNWLVIGLERGRGVARVETKTGKGYGTGFLIRGGDLRPEWGDEYLLVTNNHVLNREGVGNALRPAEATVKFHGVESASRLSHNVIEILAESPSNELDFTVLRLDPPASLARAWPVSVRQPNSTVRERLYALGHPLGGDLSISMQDNRLLAFRSPFVHYRTPTDPGSSGSPIFDADWNLVALHHSGGKDTRRLDGQGTYDANEGIWIEAIRRHLSGSPPVPQELNARRKPSSLQSTALTESPRTLLSRKGQSMSESQKQERLRHFVSQIASPDRLESLRTEAPRMVESVSRMEAAPAQPAVTPEAAESAIRKMRTGEPLNDAEMSSMEAIVLPRERPVVFIENDTFATPESPWEHFSNPGIKTRIEAAIPSIGRVELPDNPQIPFGGTAFVVGPGLLMTNRHVAELFAAGLGRQVMFRSGQSAGWDPHRERTSLSGDDTVLEVQRILMIHPFWDMALLAVSGLRSSQRPLTLAVVSPEQLVGIEVAVIGYPAKDLRNDSDLQDRIFQRTYNVKRLQPGKINPRDTISSFGNSVSALTHDSSTLGGNSGSAIVDVHTGAVVGLHFAGLYLKANYAVPTWELARDRRIVDLGVNFSGPGAAEDPNVTRIWQRLEPREPREVISRDVSVARPIPRPLPTATATRTASVRLEVGNLRFSIPVEVSVSGQDGEAVPTREAVAVDGLIEATPPVIFPRLDKRDGYDSDFLKLGEPVPLPELTAEGKKIVARLDDGSPELKYHKFSVVMHKQRRMALFTASNVDYRDKVRKINGKKPSRKELNGFVTDSSELWVTDERIPENQQLPDKFYTKDGGAFDKGHIVRRDDVCWGTTFKDMQMGNGDTFHTTNCSPQVSGFNQSAQGEDNWGDLEAMIQQQTKSEQVIIFSGPVLDDEEDLRFEGVDKRGEVTIQIPSRFWKIVVAKGANGPEAYGFLLEQDLSTVPLEFAVPASWRRYTEKISEIEDLLFGKVSLDWLKKHDQYQAARARKRR